MDLLQEKNQSLEIAGHTLEYFDDEHIYLVDGVAVPSITQILAKRFGNKYAMVNKDVLQKAAEKGTAVHEAIERFCKTGEESPLEEVRNFKFLQKQYRFEVLANEIPVILFLKDEPIAAGRLDMVIKQKGQEGIGGADIKRTATLDKNYLAYQLNLYRIAYRQSWGVEWQFLRGIHLRDDTRKFVQIPIDEHGTWQLIHEYLEDKNE